MNRRHLLISLTACAVSAPIPGLAGSGGLSIHHPEMRPTLPNRPGAVYAGIHNDGQADDRLVGASAPGVAKIELHMSSEVDGVAKMEKIEALVVPAGGVAHLAPGSAHLMLMGIEDPLKEGETLPLTLEFENAGMVEVTVSVATKIHGHGSGHAGGNMHHGNHDRHHQPKN